MILTKPNTLVRLNLIVCHSVHFVDQDLHLISAQMTKVQDAYDMHVLQLTGRL